MKELTIASFEMKKPSLADEGVRFSRGEGKALQASGVDDLSGSGPHDEIITDLAGVSETMLWSLHNRASEARRHNGVLTDPDSVRIHEAIDYDFDRHFGEPAGSLAVRAAEIDRVLRQWLVDHPDGFIVALGEGLETQVHRVDNGRMHWLSVDLPDAIRLRACFLAPSDRFRHIGVSALDPSWMDLVDPSSGLFIVAQGLLMYLDPAMVHQLLSRVADRFPEAEIVFDVIPRWFSRLTLLGLQQTPHYRLPPMPWGINRNEIEPTLRQWCPHLASVTFLDYRVPRGAISILAQLIHHIPVIRHEIPSLVHAMAGRIGQSAAISKPISGATREPTLKREEPSHDFMGLTPHRNQLMTSTNDNISSTKTIDDLFAEAPQSAEVRSGLAVTAGQIIARRVSLGMAAAFDPLGADHVELARIVPEKVEAFSAASMIMIKQSNQARRQITRFASDEVMTTARATISMAGCLSPMALAAEQGRFALAWFDRAISSYIAIGMLALSTPAAAMAPIRETVAANAERLGL